MKKKDIQELRNRAPGELEKMIRDDSDKLRSLRFDLAAGKVKNVAELHEVRKRIARAKTFMNQNTVQKNG